MEGVGFLLMSRNRIMTPFKAVLMYSIAISGRRFKKNEINFTVYVAIKN